MKTVYTKILTLVLVLLVALSLLSCNAQTTQSLKLVDVTLTEEEYAFVCKKGNVSLVESFNEFLTMIQENGELEKIENKYFRGEGEKIGYEVVTSDVENTDNRFIVATNCPFEPFEYMYDDGKIYGFDIEIAAAYAEYHGLELVIKNINFNEIFVQVEAGYADIGMAGITVDAERAEAYSFTKEYYGTSQRIIVRADNEDFNGCTNASEAEAVLRNLKGESIGYQSATTAMLYLNGDDTWGFEGFSNIESKAYSNANVALSDLLNGNLYAVLLDEAPAIAMVNAVNEAQNLNFDAKIKNFFETLSNEYYLSILAIGIWNTLQIAFVGLAIGILIGTLIAIVRVAPKYKLVYRILDKLCTVYTAIFRGTPIVAQLLIMYYVVVPACGIKADALSIGMLAFGLNSGAYVSEIMRGGIASVDKGQTEAGRALGLSYSATMVKIVIPQAIKNILPTLGNELISLIKETSVLSFIAVYDLYKALLDIGMVKYDSMIPYLMMGLIYIIIVLGISAVVKIIERRFAKSDRN